MTVINATGDFTQFVDPNGLALDTESLNQILEVFGGEDENTIIQQAVCTIEATNGNQFNITVADTILVPIGSINVASYFCSLPVPTKPTQFPLTEPIPIS